VCDDIESLSSDKLSMEELLGWSGLIQNCN